MWERFHRIKLPTSLAFFAGRRFVPMINALVLLVLGVVFGLIFPFFNHGLTVLGDFVTGHPVVGGGIYGFANRLLIPLGLHNVLNVLLWFVVRRTSTGRPATSTGSSSRTIRARVRS